MTDPPRSHADFVRETTVTGHAPMLPELRLRLATSVTPLWEMTERQLDDIDLPPPFWAFAWAGGQAVARWVLDTPHRVAGKRVLDFACGGGVVALAAARAGAARVEACDIDPLARAATMLNAADNRLGVAMLEHDVLAVGAGDWEVILAGDVCYDKRMADRVLPWLRHRAADGALVVIGDPGRAYLPTAGVEDLADFDVPVTLELEDREIKPTRVMRLWPAEGKTIRLNETL